MKVQTHLTEETFSKNSRIKPLVNSPTTPLPNTGPVNEPSQTFPQTGFAITGAFLHYWQLNGGLPIFGYPVDSERQGDGRVYQWFERTRLEQHPENSAPYDVELGLLGSQSLAKRGIDWRNLPTVTSAPQDCRYFVQTGHSLCGEFLAYWQQHGLRFDADDQSFIYAESLALFGYPISEPVMELNSSGEVVLTQWFERARFEQHPDNPPAYRVLLGRLGAELK